MMIKDKKPYNHYWTVEKLKEDALKYKTRSEWQKNSSSAYSICSKLKLLNECCEHMEWKQKPHRYWTVDKVKEDALKYKTRTEWVKNSAGAYDVAHTLGIVDECCKHMIEIKKPSGYWTLERCKEEALKYETIKEFKEKNMKCYSAINSNKWTNELCSHMKATGHKFKRMIYAYEFSDNSVYVGLTCNEYKRNWCHFNEKTSVKEYIDKTGLIPNYKIISDYINVEEARILECKTVEEYKSKGWNILNKNKTGCVGGSDRIYTPEKCKEVALLCKTRTEFIQRFCSAYKKSLEYGIRDEICSHMKNEQMPKGYWTFEKCKETALVCNSEKEFQQRFHGGYLSCVRNNWLNHLNYKSTT